MESIKPKLTQELLRLYARRCEEQGSCTVEKTFRAGEFLIHQGETPQKVFLLLKGAVKIYHSTLKGNEFLMAIVGPGEILGEAEILTGEPQTCSVKTLWESKVAVLSRKAYLDWLSEDKCFSLSVNQVLCYRLQNISTRAATHLSYPLEYSILKLFQRLAEEKKTTVLKITKNEIADYLGASVRSINRILKKYEEQKVIRTMKGEILILSLQALDKLMGAFEI